MHKELFVYVYLNLQILLNHKHYYGGIVVDYYNIHVVFCPGMFDRWLILVGHYLFWGKTSCSIYIVFCWKVVI